MIVAVDGSVDLLERKKQWIFLCEIGILAFIATIPYKENILELFSVS